MAGFEFDLEIVNTLLNGATILTFVAYFWWQNQRGNIITRRENVMMLALKDQIIQTKDDTILELRKQNAELLEVGQLIRQFILSVQAEKERQEEAEGQP